MSAHGRIVILVLGGIVVAGLLALARRDAAVSDALRQAIASEATMHQRLQTEFAAAQTRRLTPAPSAPTVKVKVQTAASASPQRQRPIGISDVARQNPQIWNDFLSLKRVEYRGYYAAFFRRSGITTAQRERILEILAQGLTRSVDIGSAAKAKDLSYDDPVVQKLHKDSEHQTNAELAEFLGPARYSELERFQRAEQVRGFVDGLAVQVAEFAPLTAQQADRLEVAIAAASPEFREGKRAQAKTLEWEQIDLQEKEILTPQQYSVWARGSAHNPLSGSRRDLELEAAYDRAIAKVKAQGGG